MITLSDFPALRRLARFAAMRSREDRVPQVAGSLTFTTVLAIVPLITVMFAIFTAFPIFSTFRDALQTFLSERLMPPSVNQQIFDYLNEFAAKAKAMTTAGMLVLVVTALITMMTIESALNVIWRVPKPRPLGQRLLIYWAVLTLAPVIFGISVSLSTYLLTRSLSTVTGALPAMPYVKQWALSLVSLPFTVVGFMLLYVYVPNCRVEWRDALIGGLSASLAFELTKRGFGLYIRHFPTYTAVYGAFAAFPIFLIWVYLSWFITLFGATITSALPEIRAGHYFRPRFPGSDLFDALGILARLVRARDDGRMGYTAAELARRLRRDLDTAVRLLALLEGRGWIARLHREGAAARWVLIAKPSGITMSALFDLLVVDREELAFQAGLDSSRVDGETLIAALQHDNLATTLQDLITRREMALANRRAGRRRQGETGGTGEVADAADAVLTGQSRSPAQPNTANAHANARRTADLQHGGRRAR